MQGKLTTQGKRGKKVTKWSVQILESGVGREGPSDSREKRCAPLFMYAFFSARASLSLLSYAPQKLTEERFNVEIEER